MLAENLDTFHATVHHQTVGRLTLLARPATSAVKLVIFPETALKRLPTVTFLEMLSTSVLPLWLLRLHPWHRSIHGSPRSIGRDELSISMWYRFIESPFCIWI